MCFRVIVIENAGVEQSWDKGEARGASEATFKEALSLRVGSIGLAQRAASFDVTPP